MKETAVKRHFDAENERLDKTEQTEMATTVPARINWFMGHMSKFLDVQVQKDLTNQKSKADIILDDGTIIAKDVPATTLLMLETKLGNDLRGIFEAVPTLDAGTVWNFDASQGLWATGPTKTFVTKKTMKAVTLAPATDKHPAQVKEVVEDVPIASIEKTIYSGMLTSGQKAALLTKLDTLVAAVKKARQRANATEVVTMKDFGETLTKFFTNELKLGV